MQRDLGGFGRWVPINNQQESPEAVENSKDLSLLLSNQLYVLPHTSQEQAWKLKALKIFCSSL